MKYQEYIDEIKEELGERLELVMLRLSSMAKEEVLEESYAHYFKEISEYTLELYQIWVAFFLKKIMQLLKMD